ncbi:hypothetical protein [Mycolicibacterium neworleansense]|uniref:hypothetical protein n=1 Tax=Mycolicibacterium neworleansense TaxID=146018 RepID=UPI00103D3A82|nr:hypothetical protein [Mycolicibacterium neworleansense]MCV7364742.1 hypothetical protein [Mycolicibacterium neworleansense]
MQTTQVLGGLPASACAFGEGVANLIDLVRLPLINISHRQGHDYYSFMAAAAAWTSEASLLSVAP